MTDRPVHSDGQPSLMKVLTVSLGTLLAVQVLSFLSLGTAVDLSDNTIRIRPHTLMLLALGSAFYLAGAATAALLLAGSARSGIFVLQSAIPLHVARHRALYLFLAVDLLVITLGAVHGSLRRDLFTGLLTFLGIPISLIATKLPLVYALTLRRLDWRRFGLLSLHYVFLAVLYESKMGLIYIVLLAFLFLRAAGVALVGLAVAVGIGMMVIWGIVTTDLGDAVDIASLLSLALDAFLNRFDSIKVAMVALEPFRSALSINGFGDALASLMPTCSATRGCLNLSAQVSENIIGIDSSKAVYEINVTTEAVFLFGELAIPFYTFLVAFVAQVCSTAFSVRFSDTPRAVPASAVCYVLLATSIWSAGLLSTRVLFFFLLELGCLALIIKLLFKGSSYGEAALVRP